MSIEEKIKTAKEDSWLKDSVSEEEFKEIKDNERRMTNEETFCWCDGCKEYDTENRCCHRYSSFILESLQENINAVLEDIKAEIDKLPRIKVGNSNSPTVKYCIDERLLYEILEKMKGE